MEMSFCSFRNFSDIISVLISINDGSGDVGVQWPHRLIGSLQKVTKSFRSSVQRFKIQVQLDTRLMRSAWRITPVTVYPAGVHQLLTKIGCARWSPVVTSLFSPGFDPRLKIDSESLASEGCTDLRSLKFRC
ncbi:hypothetical protein NPIL_643761 [Nephila pilipes]|uniref:Uncharacterized protein n=1 Tax=Nephila pilipes TaxID=299642 RepID=A0A8X6U9E8_NEPPI|nr:hypothetical protein NPIL_643761 [Nephila pilipes]